MIPANIAGGATDGGRSGAASKPRLRGLNPDITYTVSSVPDGAVTTHTGAELTEGSLVTKMAREEAGIWRITESNKPDAGDA